MNRQQRRKLERFGVKTVDINQAEAYTSDFLFIVNGKAVLSLNGPEENIKKLMNYKFPDTMRQVKEQTSYNLKAPCTLSVSHDNKTMTAHILYYEKGKMRAAAEGSPFNMSYVPYLV